MMIIPTVVDFEGGMLTRLEKCAFCDFGQQVFFTVHATEVYEFGRWSYWVDMQRCGISNMGGWGMR